MVEKIDQICQELKEKEDVAPVLMRLPLVLRNSFASSARLVPSSSPQRNLAEKIRKATTCVLSGTSIVSWNVDSLRARVVDSYTATYKGPRFISPLSPMADLITEVDPDIICLQETKLKGADLENFEIEGFYTAWNCSGPPAKNGYSGVAIWSKEKPLRVSKGLPGLSPLLEAEGRILTAYFPGFAVVNTYAPNTLRAGKRPRGGWEKVKDGKARKAAYDRFMTIRKQFDDAVLAHLLRLQEKLGAVIWCGDFNVMRGLQDYYVGAMTRDKLARERSEGATASRIKTLEKRITGGENDERLGGGAGFRLEERQDIEKVFQAGFADVFRALYPAKYGFTYWDRTKVHYRKANNGMRLDYFVVSPSLLPCVEGVRVLEAIGKKSDTSYPSDHAPLLLSFRQDERCATCFGGSRPNT